MIAFTARTVAFSPAHAVFGGCSVSLARYHETAGSVPSAASLRIFGPSTTWVSQYGFAPVQGGAWPGAQRSDRIAATPECTKWEPSCAL